MLHLFSQLLWIPSLLIVLILEKKAIRQTKSLMKKYGLSLTTNYTGSIDYKELLLISGFPESKEMKFDIEKLMRTKSLIYSCIILTVLLFVLQLLTTFQII
jgi:hypothetical protein